MTMFPLLPNFGVNMVILAHYHTLLGPKGVFLDPFGAKQGLMAPATFTWGQPIFRAECSKLSEDGNLAPSRYPNPGPVNAQCIIL